MLFLTGFKIKYELGEQTWRKLRREIVDNMQRYWLHQHKLPTRSLPWCSDCQGQFEVHLNLKSIITVHANGQYCSVWFSQYLKQRDKALLIITGLNTTASQSTTYSLRDIALLTTRQIFQHNFPKLIDIFPKRYGCKAWGRSPTMSKRTTFARWLV